jgi:glyoxylase-like metal-dependent hydrolase (beta-lactamase superfamily II)
MTEPRIVTIPILPFGMSHCHLIIGPKGCILVDTGIPGSEAKIERVLSQHGLGLRDISLIVITHAHTDHAGSAARLRELTGAPILAHVDDLDYYERRKEMTYCVAHWWGPLFLRSGLPGEPYQAFTPDILLQDDANVDLNRYGVDGVARHTPGHTAGSVSVELTSGDALVGDLVASGVLIGGLMRKDRALRPPFEDDPQMVSGELLGMVDAGMQRFHMGHGGPLPAKEVRRHALALRGLEPGRAYGLRPVSCDCDRRELAEIVD